jgi:hypothetical protein
MVYHWSLHLAWLLADVCKDVAATLQLDVQTIIC